MPHNNGTVFVAIGSLTQAMRAQEALSRAAIPSTVKKSASARGHGCVHGVQISALQENNAMQVLYAHKIHVRERISE
ncbi:MAG: hypothetical protein E7664_03375 [Ruminococcaceae bacterium]|nr:hypothetical protein [Oscillospiraceae bacterium]